MLKSLSFLLLVCCSGLAVLPACSPCNRSGCEATAGPAADTGHSAIAGAVAAESDVVGNGCQECGFSSATLAIWKTSAPIADSASAMAVVNAGAATATVQADGRYSQALDPGSYLVCRRPDCVSVDVAADHVTTVHVRLINGPAQFIVFDAQARAPRDAATLEVGL